MQGSSASSHRTLKLSVSNVSLAGLKTRITAKNTRKVIQTETKQKKRKKEPTKKLYIPQAASSYAVLQTTIDRSGRDRTVLGNPAYCAYPLGGPVNLTRRWIGLDGSQNPCSPSSAATAPGVSVTRHSWLYIAAPVFLAPSSAVVFWYRRTNTHSGPSKLVMFGFFFLV